MDLFRTIAILFGLAFLAAGIMGFMPMFISNDLLLGIFEVDNMHNWVHIASGVIALLCSFKTHAAKLFFKIFGIIYGLVTVVGFVNSGDLILMHVNTADNILHLVISVIALWLGFFV